MRQQLIKAVLAVALVLVMGGCASGYGGGDPWEAVPSDQIQVRVLNHNWSDVNVYVVRLGTRLRLGTVASMREELFDLPRGFMASSSDVRLMIDPIGSRFTYTTEPILVSPGQTIDMRVENNIHLTNWAVW